MSNLNEAQRTSPDYSHGSIFLTVLAEHIINMRVHMQKRAESYFSSDFLDAEDLSWQARSLTAATGQY